MSSSDSDDFEKFLHSVRTPKCKKQFRLSTGSLEDFIVNSGEEEVGSPDSLKHTEKQSSCIEADQDIVKRIESLSIDNLEKSFSSNYEISHENKVNEMENTANRNDTSSDRSNANNLKENEKSLGEQESSFSSFCEDHESKENLAEPSLSTNLESPHKQKLYSPDTNDIKSNKSSYKGQTNSPRNKKSVLLQLSLNQPSLSKQNLSEKCKASPWTPLKQSPFGKGKSVSTPFKKVVFSSDSEEEIFEGNNSITTASTRFTFSDSAESVDNFDKPAAKPLLLLSSDSDENIPSLSTHLKPHSDSAESVDNVGKPATKPLLLLSSDSDENVPSLSTRLKPQLKQFDLKKATPPKSVKKTFLILSSDSDEEAPSLSTRLKPRSNKSDISRNTPLSPQGIPSLNDRVSLTDRTNVFHDTKTKSDRPSRASTENFYTPKHNPIVKHAATEKCDRSKMHCSVKGCFLTSLDLPVPKNKGKPFQRTKSEITSDLFKLFNSSVFDDRLPKDMEVTWAKRLTKTAGITRCQRVTKSLKGPDDNIILSRSYVASISLSDKVIDSACRLRDTLIHEMCHAAVWLLNNTNEGHGPFWKSWAARARRSHPELPMIERCHNYDIAYKYMYRCTKCQSEIGRHSKSIDTDKKVCGRCRGRLSLVTKGTQPDGTPSKPRRANPFANFVKSNYKDTRQRLESSSAVVSHRAIMKSLSDQFRTVSLS